MQCIQVMTPHLTFFLLFVLSLFFCFLIIKYLRFNSIIVSFMMEIIPVIHFSVNYKMNLFNYLFHFFASALNCFSIPLIFQAPWHLMNISALLIRKFYFIFFILTSLSLHCKINTEKTTFIHTVTKAQTTKK